MRREALCAWALRQGATPEVAAELEGYEPGEHSDPLVGALIELWAEGAERRLAAERRRWAEMASVTILALLAVRP